MHLQSCMCCWKETIEIIRSEMREMSLVLEDVAKDLKSENLLFQKQLWIV